VFNQRGFTLIELMIALVLSSIVIAAVFTVFTSQEKIYNIQDQISEAQQNVRVGLDWIVKEIRMAGFDPTGSAGAGIVVADAGSIQITADLDSDGNTDETDEDINFHLYDSGGDGDLDLGRESPSGNTQPVVENISNNGLKLRYFDGAGNELTSTPLSSADRAAVRTIEITLTAQTTRRNQDTGEYITRTLTSRVTPRNLSD